MNFADFHAGQVLTQGPVRVTEADIVAFATAYDPQWFHTDRARASAGRWRGLIASGWHTCSIAMRLVCEGPLSGSESIGSPGLAYVKWPAPVRPGDQLTSKRTCSKRERRARRVASGAGAGSSSTSDARKCSGGSDEPVRMRPEQESAAEGGNA
jgi:acyl dehydratase